MRFMTYSLNKKEWICSLFKEWILEKSEIRVNLEWTFVLFTHFGVTSGITRNPWVIPVVTPKWVNNTNVHSKSEHIHSFFFREYTSRDPIKASHLLSDEHAKELSFLLVNINEAMKDRCNKYVAPWCSGYYMHVWDQWTRIRSLYNVVTVKVCACEFRRKNIKTD